LNYYIIECDRKKLEYHLAYGGLYY